MERFLVPRGERVVDGTGAKRPRVVEAVEAVVIEDEDEEERMDARDGAGARVDADVDADAVVVNLADDERIDDNIQRRLEHPPSTSRPPAQVHSFFTEFARRRDAARDAKARGETATETIAEFVAVKPAPIEEALGPIHVGWIPRVDLGIARTEPIPRRCSQPSSAPPPAHAFKMFVPDDVGESPSSSSTSRFEPRPRPIVDEVSADAYLRSIAETANALEVELDGAPAALEEELARARGDMRNVLAGMMRRGGGDDSKVNAQWVDRFKPDESADAPRQHERAAASLRGWLGAWRGRMETQANGKTPPSPSRPCMPRKVYTEDDDEYWQSDEDEDDGLGGGKSVANGVLISGPTGCGKTALVYALAKEFGLKVLEANVLDKRSGQDILSKFMEATQSKRFNKRKAPEPSVGLKAFFGGAESVGGTGDAAKGAKPAVEKECYAAPDDAQSLILFEEIDIQVASERGFIAALSQIVENTKRPVVFTSNTPILPELSMSLPLARVRFDALSIRECAMYGALASAVAGAPIRAKDAAAIALACDGDLRRTLHNAQFASFGDGVVRLESIDLDRYSTTLIDAARIAARSGVKRLGTIPLDAARVTRAVAIEHERRDFESMLREVEEGLIRHQDRLARWEEVRKLKRVERLKAQAKLMGYTADKPPLELKSAESEETRKDDDDVRATINASLAAFGPEPCVNEPDWSNLDSTPPVGGWHRARDELAELAALARTMSQVEVLRSTVRVGITGPCRPDVPWSKETLGDHEALEECSPGEDFYLSNGPARQTLGGNDNVSVLVSDFIAHQSSRMYHAQRRALDERFPDLEPLSQPLCAPATPVKASKRARGSTRASLADRRGSMHVTWRARVLADSLGGRAVSASATTDRLSFIARMIRIQSAPKPLASPSARGRGTRKRRQHLLIPGEIRADLLDISNFGGETNM